MALSDYLTNIAQIRSSTKRVLQEATDYSSDDWVTSPVAEEETADSPTARNGAELSEDADDMDGPAPGQDHSGAGQPPRSARRRAKKQASADG